MSARVAVIGSFVQDLAFKVATFPSTGETRIGEFLTGPGGKGSNQAVAAHRQGVPTLFIGAIGNDLFGHGYREWTEHEGLPTALLVVEDKPTGAASIVVNEHAENAIVVALGANDALTSDHVTSILSAQPNVQVLLLQAESNLKAAEDTLHYGRTKGLFSIFNPAPINPGVSPELLAFADCITPNETEAAYLLEKFTGHRLEKDITLLSDDELKALCEHLPSPTVLITVGSQGSILFQRRVASGKVRSINQGEILRIPSIPVTPVDTTGAGDAFNGGLAAGIVKFQGDLPQAIRYATVVAGLSTERGGTAPSMPTAADVQRFSQFYS